MDFKVIWSDPAIESLGEIVRHVARENAPAALRLGQQLVARAEITNHTARNQRFTTCESWSEHESDQLRRTCRRQRP